jgi:hypothetical protein
MEEHAPDKRPPRFRPQMTLQALLVAVAGWAVLFAVLRWLNVSPWASAALGGIAALALVLAVILVAVLGASVGGPRDPN